MPSPLDVAIEELERVRRAAQPWCSPVEWPVDAGDVDPFEAAESIARIAETVVGIARTALDGWQAARERVAELEDTARAQCDTDDQAPTLTFEAFRRATRGLPPAMQLDEFLRLPQVLQERAWTALSVKLDASVAP